MPWLRDGMRFVPFPPSHPFTTSKSSQAWKNNWWFVNHPFKAFFLGIELGYSKLFQGWKWHWVTYMKVVAFWGMCCGYLLMPFWTFFIATSLGPCLCHFVCRFDVAGSSFRQNAMCAFFSQRYRYINDLDVIHPQVTLKHITTSCRVKTKEK